MDVSSVRNTESESRVRVLPRDEGREHLLAMADILAKVMDTSIRIPGTSWSIGLDPLLGLIPGIGDVIANLIGTVILGIATRLQIPRIVLARMSLNLLINGTVGAVPIVGDLFSVWFRSHARNAALLREAALKPDRETHADWFYVAGIIGGTVGLLLLTIACIIWVIYKLWAVVSV
ncbi:MAG: DUF4112 domain-containing protein [Nitrospira sp.]|uniref:DUF4112 domain-containing protein n=1 Tax=Nitrospira cf. moscoviensis SBR1015 TaxID=96242 RepID=UPI000A366FA9|nr:DUF4112 domain-containing protein [Nitrospira cf. moscoviensis SBR1015]MBH0209757.1 DUF4112 domain-containing protein [Nitrospira sp.]